MTVPFEKYQGTGNDFVVIDNRSGQLSGITTEQVNFLCHRKFGIGSDGLMLIQNCDEADFEMVFFNPDGSKSLCGNGSRCAVVFAERLGLAGKEGKFITTDGAHKYRILDSELVAVQMHDVGMPEVKAKKPFLNTGSPHLVIEVPDVDQIDVLRDGRNLRQLPEFQAMNGTNVNFVSPLGDGTYGVRTYERGVENETLSCGTGVTAVALVLAAQSGVPSPLRIHTHGGMLELSFVPNGQGFSDIWLQGPVKHVFNGTINA